MHNNIQQNAPYPGPAVEYQLDVDEWCEANNVLYCETEEFNRLLKTKALYPTPRNQVRKVPKLSAEMHAKISMDDAFTGHWVSRFLLPSKGKDTVLRKTYNLQVLQYLTRGGYGLALGDINRLLKQD